MTLDTGTNPSAVSTTVMQDLKLGRKAKHSTGMGFCHGKVDTVKTELGHVRIGALNVHHLAVEVLSLEGRIGPDNKPIMGLLGYGFLQGRIVVLDYRRKRVELLASSLPRSSDDLPISFDPRSGMLAFQ